MSSILKKAKEAVTSKGEGMSGIGPDQNALQDSAMGSEEERAKYDAEHPHKYSTASKETSASMSGLGVDQSALPDDTLDKYESKYGKVDEGFADSHDASKTMGGIGPDQSSLGQDTRD